MPRESAERAKEAFISDYEALCRKYNMMVIMDSGEDKGEYQNFAVARYTGAPEEFDKALGEMRTAELQVLERE